jgi:acetolactate synthase regulatory subunit
MFAENELQIFVMSIIADDRPNLLARIANAINRRQFQINAISADSTDVAGEVWVAIELCLPEKKAGKLTTQIKKIMEVHDADIFKSRNLGFKKWRFTNSQVEVSR